LWNPLVFSGGDMGKIDPRLMTLSEAAAYCRMSVATFKAKCKVRPIMIVGERHPRYDRQQLDAWIDSLRDGESHLDEAEVWLDRVVK
jgi:hypothetical protein